MTVEEKNTESEAVESVQPSDLQEDTAAGLSLRDSLEVALEASKTDAPTTPEAKAADTPPPEPAFEPPAEFNNEEKEDFRQSSRKQQEAALRLHRSRMSRLDEIKTASREYDHVKRLAADIEPFVKAMGLKDSPSVAIQKAIALWKQFETDDPGEAKKSAAAYLKRKGLSVPRELTDVDNNPVNDVIAPLQQEIASLRSERAQEKAQQQASVLNHVWSAFSSASNPAGTPRFPDIQDSAGENGNRLASEIGSLVGGQTELSRDWIARTRARIPNATIETLLTEAYKWVGGRIDDSDQTKTQSTQKHIQQSRRAASSVPGRSSPAHSGSSPKRYKTTREAMEAAVRDLTSE